MGSEPVGESGAKKNFYQRDVFLIRLLYCSQSISTCNYQDWLGTDVLVFWGSVASNSSPVSTKYMMEAKKRGTKIIVINPYKEPAMENYWVPSVTESALFGTKIADDFYEVNIGGDIAMMHGVMKHWFKMEEGKARLGGQSSVCRGAREQLR